MDDPVEHRRLTFIALRIMGDVIGSIAVPVTVLTLAARWLERRAGGGRPVFIVVALLAAFAVSTIMLCLRAVKYNQWYLQGDIQDGSERGPPPREPGST
jgi:hypothetical protein